MATLPGGGPAEDGSELRSHACGVAKVEARGHAPGVGRIVIVTVSSAPGPARAGNTTTVLTLHSKKGNENSKLSRDASYL